MKNNNSNPMCRRSPDAEISKNYIEIPMYSEEPNEDGSYDIIGYRKEYTD